MRRSTEALKALSGWSQGQFVEKGGWAAMPDKVEPGQRSASTTNRNFEGRQGYKGRTHLVSPAMAAAAAIAGHFVDVREWH